MLNRVSVWKLFAVILSTCLPASIVIGQDATAEPSRAPKPTVAIRAGKVITSVGDPIIDGVILVADKKILAVGKFGEVVIPDGCDVIHHPNSFAMPGLVEAHSHVGGTSDLNEMVYQTNPELRNWDQIIPHNDDLKVAIAGGVTTICFIPGSGTNMGGWGTS